MLWMELLFEIYNQNKWNSFENVSLQGCDAVSVNK